MAKSNCRDDQLGIWPFTLSAEHPFHPAGIIHDWDYTQRSCTKPVADDKFYRNCLWLSPDPYYDRLAKRYLAVVKAFGPIPWALRSWGILPREELIPPEMRRVELYKRLFILPTWQTRAKQISESMLV